MTAMPASLLNQTEVSGRIDYVRYHNAESGYCVLSVELAKADKAGVPGNALSDENCFTAVGHLPKIREGDVYLFGGTWTDHPRHGMQFCFESAEAIMPSGREGVVAYLADVAYGVGPVKAARIVDALGEDALQKIEKEPECLDGLAFLTDSQRCEIKEHLAENKALAELTALICKVPGVTPALAARICRIYGADAVRLVKENPYMLSDEVWGIGFMTADRVARAVGISPSSPFRIQAAVEYIIKEAQNDGHCYLRPRDILPAVLALLGPVGVGRDEVALAAETLIASQRLTREGPAIYLSGLYKAETELAQKMRRLVECPLEVDAERLSAVVAGLEDCLGITYHAKQKEAIWAALTKRISIVTGGPGVGKTTVTRSIVDAYTALDKNKPVYLASPTGRAAKRLSEAAEAGASTIHRLLMYHPECGFRVNASEPLSPGLLIVDEFSMCDLDLANSLFDGITPEMQVVLVGDVDQLPSVGPGSVLRDSILSGVIPTTRLEFVYRQAEGSEIHLWAHTIREGHVPALISGKDVTVIACPEQEDAAFKAVEVAVESAAKYGIMGFQVLAPMKKGISGVHALNERVREAVNPVGDGREVKLCGTSYRLRDKCLVTKNDYGLEVFNGDIGQVVDLGPGFVEVDVIGTGRVKFEGDKGKILTLAYASTVHKAQGSEFSLVVVVLTRGHYVMLQKSIVYTAITRAKEHLVLIHQPGSLERAVRNDVVEIRYSNLSERLRA